MQNIQIADGFYFDLNYSSVTIELNAVELLKMVANGQLLIKPKYARGVNCVYTALDSRASSRMHFAD